MHEKQTHISILDLTSVSMLFAFMYSMLCSNVLFQLPLLGGVLYLFIRIVMLYGKWLHPMAKHRLTKRQKYYAVSVLGIALFCGFLLMSTLTVNVKEENVWLLLAVVFALMMQSFVARSALDKAISQNAKPSQMLRRLIVVEALMFLLLCAIFFLSIPFATALFLMLGYALCIIIDGIALWKNRYKEDTVIRSPSEEGDYAEITKINAYKRFQNLLLATVVSLQVTLIMAYTFISITAGELLMVMVAIIFCTSVSYFMVDFFFKKIQIKSPDPSNVLLCGIAIWAGGILFFSNNFITHMHLMAYLSLALCATGAGIVIRSFLQLERDMQDILHFALGKKTSVSYVHGLSFRMEFATLQGQLFALVLLTVMCYFINDTSGFTYAKYVENFQPFFVLPALLLVSFSLVCALFYPISKAHMKKLKKFQELEKSGKQNLPLRQQLEDVVLRRSIKHYGMKVLLSIARLFYYHKILEKENVPNDDDVAMVFVCNHGEIYGPVVSNLYVPFSFRPWSIGNMMDKDLFVQSTVQGTFSDIRWLSEKNRRRLAEFCAPLMLWVMRSIDAIPVYYNSPRQLMNSFKESIKAMEAGDNILLFPENSAFSPTKRYERDGGVSEFFTGFVMLGQLYYKQTGKRAYFVPIYANRLEHTVTFGVHTRYNPEVSANEEKERICTYLREEMLRIANQTTKNKHHERKKDA